MDREYDMVGSAIISSEKEEVRLAVTRFLWWMSSYVITGSYPNYADSTEGVEGACSLIIAVAERVSLIC